MFPIVRPGIFRHPCNTLSLPGEVTACDRVPEGKPIFTAAHNASSTSILLHWKPPSQSTVHGEFLGYRITLVPRDIPDPRPDQIVHITIKEHTATSHLVQGLRTYTQYLVSLQVFNPEGNGPTSTVAVMTDEGGE
ncbi:hypothetical protein Pmani_029905 [Petrolisthes manimaculis]|uniref:Fibronectin type-III domain-containing protein n=1 Tax=Petrolisthes manimaculis TaxID=1843537 RepID=A0AAE1NZ24_9EUCA|nr:hypothetical protein Pmani_029905 [Petrolisthes manimaculis]